MRKSLWLHMEQFERLLRLTFSLSKESYEVKLRIMLSRMSLTSKGRRWHRDLRACSIFCFEVSWSGNRYQISVFSEKTTVVYIQITPNLCHLSGGFFFAFDPISMVKHVNPNLPLQSRSIRDILSNKPWIPTHPLSAAVGRYGFLSGDININHHIISSAPQRFFKADEVLVEHHRIIVGWVGGYM